MASEKMEIPESARAWFRGSVLAAAVIAFCMQPLMRYVDPDWYLAGGTFLGASFLGFSLFISDEERLHSLLWGAAGAILALAGVYFLAVGAYRADMAAIANDQRCLTIQRDILSAKPRRSDGPDLFQALGCRPQGDGKVALR
ncbi:hypothetical protein [Sphingomonas yabuuchiae]|uniref:hypothetical protein n=1 Tax=Sphingomonas yabuuchiae TaxID=172044 RepID=UPI003D96A5A8